MNTPPLTRALLAATVAAFLLAPLAGPRATTVLALWPLASGLFRPWQVVSYALLHGGWLHLTFNMIGLWMFASELEAAWGARRLALFYAFCVASAALAQLAVTAWLGSPAPTVGASGGIFGLLAGFAMVFPRRTIVPLLPPIPMPAWLFVTLYGAVELVLGVTGSANGVAHFAHLGGLCGGWLLVRWGRWQTLPGRAAE